MLRSFASCTKSRVRVHCACVHLCTRHGAGFPLLAHHHASTAHTSSYHSPTALRPPTSRAVAVADEESGARRSEPPKAPAATITHSLVALIFSRHLSLVRVRVAAHSLQSLAPPLAVLQSRVPAKCNAQTASVGLILHERSFLLWMAATSFLARARATALLRSVLSFYANQKVY